MDAGVQAMMEPAIQMLDACPPPPPGQDGGSGGEVDAPCCQGCQDGCGGYKSRSGDYGEDAIAPECLNPDHTRVVRGVTMGICDSDGQTDYDGQPCSRDCEDRCPDPGKALESCDLDSAYLKATWPRVEDSRQSRTVLTVDTAETVF